MNSDGHSGPMDLGFIGGALHSAVGYAHFAAATMDFAWRVCAGCFSRDPAQNLRSAQAYGVEPTRTYHDWREFIAAEHARLDAVVILTPTPDHFEMAMSCIDAGVPVICEKALATSVGEVASLREAVVRKKAFLGVTYNYSGYPMLREMRRMISTGKLGRILHFQAEMPQEGFIRLGQDGRPPKPQRWRLQDGDIPTLYLDLAIHLHHLIGYVTGAGPLSVVAQQASYGWFADVIDDVSCLCKYSNGIHGHLWFSKAAIGHRNGLRVRIYGSAGSAEWFQADPEQLMVSWADGRREILDRASPVEVAAELRYARFKPGHPAGFVEAFANLYRDFAVEVRGHRRGESRVTGEVFGVDQALEGVEFLDAICRSARSGAWEEVRSAG